ncbi:hypothetical protein I3U40_18215 [Mycobacteroides abscessus subsp. abscessus]|uniref:hypothetical protein n=1 Tax=Mycobacteroides abscessus TaxID=36809 RepID=UPI0009A6F137|nr:hypothetical protein [Mycobacteroides abscessus]QSM92992.1 hypothetical protein I3U31_18205 [Mycobacteroides abscessus subsp. abscessus]QSM98030.1 hypothetical protein I3U40_18215 [Mycobacteroides abscessus subsp. abscessus]SLI40924.1 Uncharacterised protein [Mycobacteroides abscessus subsp. abscessus]
MADTDKKRPSTVSAVLRAFGDDDPDELNRLLNAEPAPEPEPTPAPEPDTSRLSPVERALRAFKDPQPETDPAPETMLALPTELPTIADTVRKRWEIVMAAEPSRWFQHPSDSQWSADELAAIRAACNGEARGLTAGARVAEARYAELLSGAGVDAAAIITRLVDTHFLRREGDLLVASDGLPAPEPAPANVEPEPAQPVQITLTDEERKLLTRAALAHNTGVRVYPGDEKVAAALVARGLLVVDPDHADYRYYSHPDDHIPEADLRTVRDYTTAVVKKLRDSGRNSLTGLDEKVGADTAVLIKRRLDGVLIQSDGQGRWALIGGKPRLTAADQRERAEAKAAASTTTTADGDAEPAPTPAPTPEATTLHEVREVKTMVAALLTAHNVRPASPSSHPRAHGMAETQWRIAVVLQALGPSLMSAVTAGYLTKSQREHTNSAIAQGLLDGVFEEVPADVLGFGRKPRIKVVAPPKGRTWDELHAAAEEVRARDAAKRVSA